MNNQVPKYVTCGRAALLLGIPEDELNRISSQSGLGHTEYAGEETGRQQSRNSMHFCFPPLR